MIIDMNLLERKAAELFGQGRIEEAREIYVAMADGDASLDAGYLGMKIGLCFEKQGKFVDAKYWFNRAEEENPGVRSEVTDALKRLNHICLESRFEEILKGGA